MANVALLGTGRMGIELGRHLIDAGHHLTVWNRTAAGAEPLVAAGAIRANTAKQAAENQDIVITCLFGPDAVQQVVTTPNLLSPGTLWLDITTVGPDDADKYAQWAQTHQVRYVHGPVVGSLGPAKARELGVYLGGNPNDTKAAREYAALWADPDRLVEVPTARAAAIGKLLANLALGIALEGLTEALRFGKALGIDSDSVLTMLKSTGLGFIADMKSQIIKDQTFTNTQFSVDLLAKDARLMLAAVTDSTSYGNKSPNNGEPPISIVAENGQIELPAVSTLLNSLERAQKAGHGDEDIAAIVIPEITA